VEGASAAPSLSELANAPGKLPPLPDGEIRTRGRELGETLNWGDGTSNHPGQESPQAITAIRKLDQSTIEASGLTLEEALLWAGAYESEAIRNPRNVSAGPRAQLMRCIAKTLNGPLFRSPLDCCLEELRWRHPSPGSPTR
jgi:hypothetical protein